MAAEIGLGSVIASRYEVLSCLGAGGMGIVFKARDRVLGVTVALKVARLSLPFDGKALDRLRSEVRLARRVHHRNVCVVHDYGEDADHVFLSMEYVDGRDLKAVLKERRTLPWEDAYAIVLQIADGLVAIHEAGVIHRDLKPGNVMVDSRGVVRVLDFGIARWENEQQTTSVAGAPDYMAPEQVRGRALDGRTDVYCFGCLIYETFTGWPPFCADSPLGVMLKHLEEPPVLEGARAAGLPRSLIPVLARALAKEPADRYASSRAMREALAQARSSLDSDTTDLEVIRTAAIALPPRRRRSPPAFLLGVVLAGLAATVPLMMSSRAVSLVPSNAPTVPRLEVVASTESKALPPTPPPLGARHSATPVSQPKPAPASPSPTPVVSPAPTASPTEALGSEAPASVLPTTIADLNTTATTLSNHPRPEVKPGDLVDINDPGVTPPICEACAKPRTPMIAEHSMVLPRLRGKGHIVLRVLVDEKGRVIEVKPQRQVEFLTEAADKAVRKWRYRPAAKDGVPVKVWIGVAVLFQLPSEPLDAFPPSSPTPAIPRP